MIALRTQLDSIQATAETTKANTEELIQRAQGKIPERPPNQSAAERKREIDQVLKSVPALRTERKQMADLERQEAKDEKLAAQQQKSAGKRRRTTTSQNRTVVQTAATTAAEGERRHHGSSSAEVSGADAAAEPSAARVQQQHGDEQIGACETARTLTAGDTVKILTGPWAGEVRIVSEARAGSYAVDPCPGPVIQATRS